MDRDAKSRRCGRSRLNDRDFDRAPRRRQGPSICFAVSSIDEVARAAALRPHREIQPERRRRFQEKPAHRSGLGRAIRADVLDRLLLIFLRAEPLCMARWSVLSLLITYWGSSFEARTVYPLNVIAEVIFFLIVPRTRPASEFHPT